MSAPCRYCEQHEEIEALKDQLFHSPSPKDLAQLRAIRAAGLAWLKESRRIPYRSKEMFKKERALIEALEAE